MQFVFWKWFLNIVVLHISKSVWRNTFNGSYIFVKSLDTIFFKHWVEEYLARD